MEAAAVERRVPVRNEPCFLEDTDDIIHQAKREALEEWRRDNAGSFEKDDGCQPSEHMK